MTEEQQKYYNKMMAQAPEGLDLEDWEAEILDDIASMEGPRDIVDKKMSVQELDFMIDNHERIKQGLEPIAAPELELKEMIEYFNSVRAKDSIFKLFEKTIEKMVNEKVKAVSDRRYYIIKDSLHTLQSADTCLHKGKLIRVAGKNVFDPRKRVNQHLHGVVYRPYKGPNVEDQYKAGFPEIHWTEIK